MGAGRGTAQSPAVFYTPSRILGIKLRAHSASGALAALGEAEEQAAGAKTLTPSLSLPITSRVEAGAQGSGE